MNAPERTQPKRRCSHCGQVAVQSRMRDEHFEYECAEGDFLVEATAVPVETCESCGETYSGVPAALVRNEAIARALRLLSAKEILILRESTAKTREEFSRLTGISVKDIADWERGRSIPERAMDRYLRLLIHNPENLRLLDKVSTQATAGSSSPANGPVSQHETPNVTPAQTSATGMESSR